MASPSCSLSGFKVIGFDTMGTLLDEKVGCIAAFQPILPHLPPTVDVEELFEEFETALQKEIKANQPPTTYETLLANACASATRKMSNGSYTATTDQSLTFAKALAEWPAFDDTVTGLQYLAKGHKLILLSNMETSTLGSITTRGALKDVTFAALLGNDMSHAFKPDHRVNQNLLDTAQKEYGVGKDQVLLIAQGLGSDHVPAREMGLASAWIDRYGQGQKGMEQAGAKPTWVFQSLQQLVDEMKRSV